MNYQEMSNLCEENDRAMKTLTDLFGTDERGRKQLHEFIDAWLNSPERQQ